MSKLNQSRRSSHRQAQWAWFLPILVLAPLAMAPKGCTNAGVIGDDCPTDQDCPTGTAGTSSQAGTGNTSTDVCGGLMGASCDKGEFCNFPADAKCGSADQTGVCQKLPQACDLIYAPVCGCDDKTYGNECAAHSAGVSVASLGECGGTGPTPGDGACGGLLGATCAKGEYCQYAPDAMCGAADQTGKCATLPQGCRKIYEPVCGCDNQTYGNDCEAASAGVSVAYAGVCKTAPGGTCGGRSGAMCGTTQFCQYPPEADCGRFDAPGKCVDLPKGGACDAIYAPVCGCNGRTYGNDCEALNAGVSIDFEGECEPTGTICGGFTGEQCGGGEYCDYPLEMACGNADGTGECKPLPENCTEEYAPVCGCDGETYGNACAAAMKGVSVAAVGVCK